MKIANRVKTITAALAALATGVVLPGQAFADAEVNADTAQQFMGGNTEDNLMETLNIVINVAIGVIGFVAVVMIIYGGFQYTTSAGDAAKVKKAKDTIMYGVIGLVVALLAFAIVNFVLGNIFA